MSFFNSLQFDNTSVSSQTSTIRQRSDAVNSQHSDTKFSGLLHNTQADAVINTQENNTSPTTKTIPTDRLQHRSLSLLSQESEAIPLSRGIQLRPQDFRGIALHQAAQEGIALPDRSKGFALNSIRRGGALPNAAQEVFPNALSHIGQTQHAEKNTENNTTPFPMGFLSAQFESGSAGVSAIGYDRTGGTSYGKYQIASRPGSMQAFIEFLQQENPQLAERLANAGPANTGSKNGEMPTVWREIAQETPQQFGELQERFIAQSHYQPALEAVSDVGYDTVNFSTALKEVLFSTAVQHGPTGAARIFRQAAEEIGLTAENQQTLETELIQNVYALRAQNFHSSSTHVQAAVQRRFEQESHLALQLTEKLA